MENIIEICEKAKQMYAEKKYSSLAFLINFKGSLCSLKLP